jgi:hypothetical protein
VRQWPLMHPDAQLEGWLAWMAGRKADGDLEAQVRETERECLRWAVSEADRLGGAALRQASCGRAWQLAGPSGELDPLEVALEGGADVAVLDSILKWRGFPNLPP